MTRGLRSIKPLSKESLRGVEPAAVGKKLPKFEFVDPKTIYVEDVYQRSMSGENNTALVRKIVGAFNWSHFKPPICVRLRDSGNVLVCVDGQHTATAAASHPGVQKIPVMVVDAADVADRAKSFVGHNRDRINLTQMAIHRADVAAGDALAMAVHRACRTAGAEVLPTSVNLKIPQPPGKTIAVGTLRSIARKDGEEFLARVLRVLVRAKRGPVKAGEIAASAAILRGEPEAVDDKLRAVVASKSAEAWSVAAAQHAMSGSGKNVEAMIELWRAEIGQEEPSIRQPETPVRQPETAIRKAQAPVALDSTQSPERFVEHNGVRIDLRDRSVQHRGHTVTVDDDAVSMVAALSRVMPAFLPAENVARKAFGSATDAVEKVRALADRANPALAGARLQVKPVAKMGWMLADLG